MDIKRKVEIVDKAIKSISEHTDADSVVVLAALDAVGTLVEAEKSRVAELVADQARRALV